MTTLTTTAGTPIIVGFQQLDQNGNPMGTPVLGEMVWSNTNTADELTLSTTGQSVSCNGFAPTGGSDVLTGTFTPTGGAPLSASVTLVFNPATQVLTSIVLVQLQALV